MTEHNEADNGPGRRTEATHEPAWVTRFAAGDVAISPFVGREIAREVRELLRYRQAMELMALQFVHPKLSARELADLQLRKSAP